MFGFARTWDLENERQRRRETDQKLRQLRYRFNVLLNHLNLKEVHVDEHIKFVPKSD